MHLPSYLLESATHPGVVLVFPVEVAFFRSFPLIVEVLP